VRPPRFLGERITGLGPVEVEGFPPIRLELYVAAAQPEDGPHGIGVYSAGTLVAAGFHELAPLGLDHAPWTDPRLAGMVDFPAFRVAPGSRRGVLIDAAAEAFADALRRIEPVLDGLLEKLERERAAELDRTLIRDLQRAFRDFYRQRPRYELLPLHDAKDPGPAGDGDGRRDEPQAAELESGEAVPLAADAASLLPPGPLAGLRIVPARIRVLTNSVRTIRALAFDESERPLTADVELAWVLLGAEGCALIADALRADRARLQAAAETCAGEVQVVGRQGDREARAAADVEIVDELEGPRANEGIPEPELVSYPGEPWRSRMLETRWQVNTAHPEYRDIDDRPAVKLRYLAMLFAKEVVLRSHQDPRLEVPLEQVVEVAAYADRNLNRRESRRARPAADASGPSPPE